MGWISARRFLRTRKERALTRSPGSAASNRTDPATLAILHAVREELRPRPALHHPISVCLVSGKGGTGKTTVAASLARRFARRRRTLLVDADMGMANAHILQDVTPRQTLVDVVEGRSSVRDVLVPVLADLQLVSGGSGFPHMAELSGAQIELIARGLDELESELDMVLVDSAAGISNQTLAFASASDLVVLITTPELTSMTDAYAFLKAFYRCRPDGEVHLLVNRARTDGAADHAASRILEVSRRFLQRSPAWVSSLPEDPSAFSCAQRRRPVVSEQPDSSLGRGLMELEDLILEEVAELRPRGLGRGLVAHFPEQRQQN